MPNTGDYIFQAQTLNPYGSSKKGRKNASGGVLLNDLLQTPMKEAIGFGSRAVTYTGVGVEIELEQDGLKKINWDDIQEHWKMHKEGSLRNGVEMVMRGPIRYPSPAYNEAMGLMKEHFRKYSKHYRLSLRTGLHVHYNILGFTVGELYNTIFNYFLFENYITNRTSETRKCNLFCLRGYDAEGLLYSLAKSVQDGSYLFEHFVDHEFKYSALNLAPVRNLGSIEFRFMDGTLDIKEIDAWVENLDDFIRRAKYISPKVVLSALKNNLTNTQLLLDKFFSKKSQAFFGQGIPSSQIVDMIDANYFGISTAFKLFEKELNRKKNNMYLRIERDVGGFEIVGQPSAGLTYAQNPNDFEEDTVEYDN